MNLVLIISLAAACLLLMLVERRGLRTQLELKFKGDLKRETQFLAQYGQSACTPLVFILIWQMDPRHLNAAMPVGLGVLITSVIVMILKRLIGRVRPGREQAGKFLGPSFKHANYRESFPSSHTACAVALSAMLAQMYPLGASTFWTLAGICAFLRYALDAHWPSDIVGGALIGYVTAALTMQYAHM